MVRYLKTPRVEVCMLSFFVSLFIRFVLALARAEFGIFKLFSELARITDL